MAIPSNLPQRSHIQGLWSFENNFNDSSSNGYHLTETSGTIDFVTGKIGKAGDFEAGDTEYLTIAHSSCPNLQITGNITLAVWVKPESLPSDTQWTIIAKLDSGANQRSYLLGLRRVTAEAGGIARMIFLVSSDGTATSNIFGTTSISAATWYHVVGVYDGSKLYLYVNGSSDNTPVSYSSGIYNSNAPFLIGCHFSSGSPTYYFDGLIDEAIVWNTALTANEVSVLYNISRYRFDTGFFSFF